MSNPVTAVFPLASDLNGTSQSGAIALTGVAPIRYSSGLYLEEGTTNRKDGTSEVNKLGHAYGPGSTALDSAKAHAGSMSTKVTATADYGGLYMQSGTSLGWTTVSTDGIWIWLPSGYKCDDLLKYVYTDASSENFSGPDIIGTDGWQFVAITATPTKTLSHCQRIITSDPSNNAYPFDFWVDDGQFENKPYATSMADYQMGSGYSGTQSNGTRAASSASISPSGIFDTYLGAIVFVATPTIETGAEEIWGELGEKLAGADHIRWGRDSTKHPFVEWSGNDSAYTRVTLTATVDAGDEHFYSIEWHVGDADFRLYLDDDPSENDTIPSPQEDYGAGPLKLQATAGGVIYGGLAICSERLTNDQRARLKVVMENRGNIETALDSKRGRYGFFQVRPKVE